MKLILEFEPEELIDLKRLLDVEKDMIYKSDDADVEDKEDKYYKNNDAHREKVTLKHKPNNSNYEKRLMNTDFNTKNLQNKNKTVENYLDNIMKQLLNTDSNNSGKEPKNIK